MAKLVIPNFRGGEPICYEGDRPIRFTMTEQGHGRRVAVASDDDPGRPTRAVLARVAIRQLGLGCTRTQVNDLVYGAYRVTIDSATYYAAIDAVTQENAVCFAAQSGTSDDAARWQAEAAALRRENERLCSGLSSLLHGGPVIPPQQEEVDA